MTAPTYFVKGEDASLVAQEVRALLAEVVGDRDHSLVVEEIGGGPGDDINVGAVVDACLTPPFLIDRRVVVVADASKEPVSSCSLRCLMSPSIVSRRGA